MMKLVDGMPQLARDVKGVCLALMRQTDSLVRVKIEGRVHNFNRFRIYFWGGECFATRAKPVQKDF